MSKQKTKKTKNQVTIGEREKARIERWRKQVTKVIDSVKGSKNAIPSKWIEEVEGRPLVDVIVDRFVNTRINNPLNIMFDESEEERGTRARNNHERDIALQEVWATLYAFDIPMSPKDRHAFIARFYKAGDRGFDAAIKRAVQLALDWERDAERADLPKSEWGNVI